VVAVSTLQNTLNEIHGFLAALAQVPELNIGEEKCRRLAVAMNEVQKHYRIPALSPGKLALATLVWTAGTVYRPVIGAMIARKQGRVPVFVPPAPVSTGSAHVPVPDTAPMVSDWFVGPETPSH